MRLGANRDVLRLGPFAGLSKTTYAQAKACATKIFEPRGRINPLQPRQVPQLQSDAVIPAEDLKPLYDFTIDCKTCQAKLATTQGDLADERKKPPRSLANATTQCASPSGSSLAPLSAQVPPKPPTNSAVLRTWRISRV